MRIPTQSGLTLDVNLAKRGDDLSSFECTELELNDFLRSDAINNQGSRLSVTWLARLDGRIVGFCTLTNDSISTKWIRKDGEKQEFEYSHYPALKIARLATHRDYELRYNRRKDSYRH